MDKKPLIAFSEHADVCYYQDGSVKVTNYDEDVLFEFVKAFRAKVKIDQEGNIDIVPFGSGENRRIRSYTVCETGVARLKVSPKGKSYKLEIILPEKLATESNFIYHLAKLFEKLRLEDTDSDCGLLK